MEHSRLTLRLVGVQEPALPNKVANKLDEAEPTLPLQAHLTPFTHLPNSEYSATPKMVPIQHGQDVISNSKLVSLSSSPTEPKAVVQQSPDMRAFSQTATRSSCIEFASQTRRRLPDKPSMVGPRRSYNIVSRVGMMSDRHSHDTHGAVARPRNVEGCSVGRSKVPPESVLCAPETTLLETVVGVRQDAMGNVTNLIRPLDTL
jgi:hypothetical protein